MAKNCIPRIARLIISLAILSSAILLPLRSADQGIEVPQTQNFPETSVNNFNTILALTQRNGAVPTRIAIQSIDLDLPVRSAVWNGAYEFFPGAATYLATTGRIGEKGNIVIYAHNLRGVFETLSGIKVGERIELESQNESHAYIVVGQKIVSPMQMEVLAPTRDEQLTLLTCAGKDKSHRLIVVAKPAGSLAGILTSNQ